MLVVIMGKILEYIYNQYFKKLAWNAEYYSL